jgi:hypothetical protein
VSYVLLMLLQFTVPPHIPILCFVQGILE